MIECKTKKEGKIISSASNLWQETHNVNKVSLEDIARNACVSPTTIYNIFKTRDGLVLAVTKHIAREMLDKQWAIINGNQPLPIKIQSMISTKTSMLGEVQHDVLAKFYENPEIKKYLDEIYETEIKPMINKLVEDGKNEGYIRTDVPNEAVMLYLDILKEGALACSAELKKVEQNKEFMLGLMRLTYQGLFKKEFDYVIDLFVENYPLLQTRRLS